MNTEIKEKIEQCLNCKTKPCTQGCPLGNNIPIFIKNAKEGKYKEAYDILSETTVLPAICGRICPHYKQCMGKCIRGIKGQPVNIGDIEKYIGDISIKEKYNLPKCEQERKEKIAIVGSGPAGLTCAAFLRRKGFKVTIYEKYNYLGGLLVHGIPEFRLGKDIVQKTVENILNLGIKVKYNSELGKDISIQELEQEYDKIFLAFGANCSSKMRVEGENLTGVYGGNELLEYNSHPDYKEKTVIVVGGGNVAMDCARTIKKLGAKEVKVVYRRAREQMPAEDKEIESAINEKIELLDTPGVLWPKFESEEVALHLCFTGTIKEEILDKVEIAYQLTKFLLENYRTKLCERYKLDENQQIVIDDLVENNSENEEKQEAPEPKREEQKEDSNNDEE